MTKKIIVLLFILYVVLGRSYPYYNQCDPRWGHQNLGTSTDSICNFGCLMTSVCMALGGSGYDFNPSTFNQWLINHGGFYDGDGYIWASTNSLGLRFQGKVSNSQLRPHLDAGYVVLCLVRGGTHWVLATGYSGDTIYVQDPAFNTNSYNINECTDGQNGIYIAPEGRRSQKSVLLKLKSLLNKATTSQSYWKLNDKVKQVEQI